jgi:hypothetical protein
MELNRTFLTASLFFVGGCASAPHDAAAAVPLGSALADLDRHLVRGEGSRGEVVERIALKDGTYAQRSLGDYDAWRASPETRARFTGTITFTHHGSTSSDVTEMTYRDGNLRKKDWGFLPG